MGPDICPRPVDAKMRDVRCTFRYLDEWCAYAPPWDRNLCYWDVFGEFDEFRCQESP